MANVGVRSRDLAPYQLDTKIGGCFADKRRKEE